MKTFYTRNIIEGRAVAIVALLFFVISRMIVAFFGDLDYHVEGGLLWQFFNKIIVSQQVSVLLSSISVLGIAFYLSHLNTHFALIRRRSSLPLVITLLIFNISPELLVMSPHYLGLFFFLIALRYLLESYQSFSSAQYGAAVGFSLALGSLFVPELLVLWILFIIGFFLMRSSSIRTILASLLSIGMVYFSLFSYYYITDQVDSFFLLFNQEIGDSIFLATLNIKQIITLSVSFIILIVVIVNYYMNHFKDKIRIRASISSFHLIGIGSILIYLLAPIHSISQAVFYPLLAVLSFLLAHFFSVAESKWKIYFFYAFIATYAIFYFWNIVL